MNTMPIKSVQSLRFTESKPLTMDLDDEIARLKLLGPSLTRLGLTYDRVLAERNDLRTLVADLRRENAALRAAIYAARRTEGL